MSNKIPKVPKGYTEQEFVDITNRIAKKLGQKFKFGYHDIDDMEQQARLYAWEALPRFDNTRSLENFLWIHVRNRLFNFKRDKFQRLDKPCFVCPLYDPSCAMSDNECIGFPDKEECDRYKGWLVRNTAKANLMRPIKLYDVNDELEKNMRMEDKNLNNIDAKEIFMLIDLHLPANLRTLYIKLRDGGRLDKRNLDKLRKGIQNILEQYGTAKV